MFFEGVDSFNYRYSAVIMNKARLYGAGFRYKDPFLKCTIKYVFKNIGDILNEATVSVDQTGDRAFKGTLQSYLKRELRREDGTTPIKRVHSEASHRNNLIQLADMICGAVARRYKDVKDADHYWRRIRKHQESLQFWPPK